MKWTQASIHARPGLFREIVFVVLLIAASPLFLLGLIAYLVLLPFPEKDRMGDTLWEEDKE